MSKQQRIPQLALILVALAATLGLYFFGRTLPKAKRSSAQAPKHESHVEPAVANIDILALKSNAIETLSEADRKIWKQTEQKSNLEKANFWVAQDRNDVAATFKGAFAEKENDFDSWNSTGDLYVRAFRETKDSTQMVYFVNQAVNAYNSALAKQQNTETKLKLAKLHTDITGQIMNGVKLLQDIVQENPNHIQANYELGLLSIRSGQDDKAIARFETLIQNKPSFMEPYILKTQLLLKKKDKEGAIQTLELAKKNAKTTKEKDALEQMKNSIINN